jgi:hypothetical protein
MNSWVRPIVEKLRKTLPARLMRGRRDALAAAFDAEYFRLQLATARIACNASDPVAFYREDAAARTLSPNPWFEEDFYRWKNRDVQSAIDAGGFLSGFDHFVRHGLREGRVPSKAFEDRMQGHVAGHAVGDPANFDANFYLLEYELARQFIKALPLLTPLEFFNLYGRRMGHVPQRSERHGGNGSTPRPRRFTDNSHELVCAEFDEDHYRGKYQNQLGDMSPLAHYLSIGRASGYSPNSGFDEMFYRAFYVDINRAIAEGKIPSGFEHYLLAGRKEGRLPKFQLACCLEQVLPGVTEPVALTKFVELEQKLTPHRHRLVEDRPRRVWFFVPRLNPDLFFGGYSTLVHLAEAFLRAGLPIGIFLFEDIVESFEYFCHRCPHSELAARRDEIPLFSAYDDRPFLLGPDDVLIVYSAWQALAAGAYARNLASAKFVFLVQEHETVFHSHDSVRFVVDMAYKQPHVALFNSSFLEKFFRQQRLGVFEHDPQSSDYMTFEHVLTPVTPPPPTVLRTRKTRRLVVYARPEPHAARNLTEICLIALRKAIAQGIFGLEYEFVGIGALSGPHFFDLGSGRTLEVRPKVDPEAYVELLQGADIGLSLMYAPHPSLIPFELVNAGAIVVTNTFSNRSSTDIRARSQRLVPVELTVDAIVAGLQVAVGKVGDIDLRTNPEHAVESPSSWREVFDADFIERLLEKLDGPGQSSRCVPDHVAVNQNR